MSPGHTEGKGSVSLWRNRLARPAPRRQGAGRGGSGHVQTGKLSGKRRVESTTPVQVRNRTVPGPTTQPDPDSLPSCRSSRTVAVTAPEPRAPWPATATPPSPPSMLAGAWVMASAAGSPRPGGDA